jgi:hypothetical protein
MHVADQRGGRQVDNVASAQQTLKFSELSTYVTTPLTDADQSLALLWLTAGIKRRRIYIFHLFYAKLKICEYLIINF